MLKLKFLILTLCPIFWGYHSSEQSGIILQTKQLLGL